MTCAFNTRKQCKPHGSYHYRCEDCGADCTMGKPAAPAYLALDKKHRCWSCHSKWQHKLAAASATTQEEINTLVLALRQLAGTRDETYDEHRERAVLWLDALTQAGV